ncbi:MAG: PIN domain-containing protein [Chloroflexota bacterium]
MPDEHLYYWDANLFMSYLNGDSDRLPVIEAILDEIEKGGKDKIVTSVLSKIEVAWVASEKVNRALSAEEEANIDSLWNDYSVIELVDFSDEVTHIARSILRRSMTRGWKPKTMDAIHLATAEWVGATEMHTYDSNLYKYGELIGIEVKAPIAMQPKLL